MISFDVMSDFDFQRFFDIQKQSITHEFRDAMADCLMATTAERLLSHEKIYGWKIAPLRGAKRTSALVVHKHLGFPELWVRHTYRSYRRAYLNYLCEYFRMGAQTIPREWEVDHLLSTHRFRADHPEYFIRLLLLPRTTNASYGAGFEKLFHGREREHEPVGGFHVDWLSFLKALGVKLPGKGVGQEAWQLWSWQVSGQIERNGIADRVLAYIGISTVLNLGYTGRYKPLPLHFSFRAKALTYATSNCSPQLHET